MTRWQRDQVVEARADAILAGARTTEAYAEHFEAQMRGTARKRPGGMRVLRRPGVALAVTSLVPLVVLGFAAFMPYKTPATSSGLNGVDTVQAASGRLMGISPLSGPPGAVSAADGSVWVADPGAGEVSRIGPGTDATTARVPVDGQPGAIASGAGAIWVADADGAVTRINPATDRVAETIRLPWAHPGAIAFGAGGLWVADPAARQLAEIDPATGSLARTLPVNLQPTAIAAVGQAIWVAGNGSPTVEELAAASGRVLAEIQVGGPPAALAVGAGSLWVASSVNATVSRIDPATSAVTAVIPVGRGPAELVAGPGSVWVAGQKSATIYRIDPGTNHVAASVRVIGTPTSLTIAGGLVYAGTRQTVVPASRDTTIPGILRSADAHPGDLPGLRLSSAPGFLVDGPSYLLLLVRRPFSQRIGRHGLGRVSPGPDRAGPVGHKPRTRAPPVRGLCALGLIERGLWATSPERGPSLPGPGHRPASGNRRRGAAFPGRQVLES